MSTGFLDRGRGRTAAKAVVLAVLVAFVLTTARAILEPGDALAAFPSSTLGQPAGDGYRDHGNQDHGDKVSLTSGAVKANAAFCQPRQILVQTSRPPADDPPLPPARTKVVADPGAPRPMAVRPALGVARPGAPSGLDSVRVPTGPPVPCA